MNAEANKTYKKSVSFLLKEEHKKKYKKAARKEKSRNKENIKKQKVKRDNVKKPRQKFLRKENVRKMQKDCAKRKYERQIQYLKKSLKQPLNQLTLTSDELQMLFTKYKLDGHYEISANLPSFNTFTKNDRDTVNVGDNMHDTTTEYVYVPDLENDRGMCDTTEDGRFSERDASTCKSKLHNFRCDSYKTNKILREHNANNMSNNRTSYVQQNPLADIGHRHMLNGNVSVSSTVQNLAQEEITKFDGSHAIEIENFHDNLSYGRSIIATAEECQNFKYAGRNFGPVVEDLSMPRCLNIGIDNFYQHSAHHSAECNNLSLNQNFPSNFCPNEWDTGATPTRGNTLPNKPYNMNIQLWNNNNNPNRVAHTEEMESHFSDKYNRNNATIICQSANVSKSFIKNTFLNSSNVLYASNSTDINVQDSYYNCSHENAYSFNSTATVSGTNNYLLEANRFTMSAADTAEMYI